MEIDLCSEDSSELIQNVNKIIQIRQESESLRKSIIQLRRKEVQLSDDTIDFICKYVFQLHNRDNVKYVNSLSSFTITNTSQELGKEKVMKRMNINQNELDNITRGNGKIDIVIIILYDSSHWSFMCWFTKKNFIQHYDSMRLVHQDIFRNLIDALKRTKIVNQNVYIDYPNVHKQTDGWSCGFQVIAILHILSANDYHSILYKEQLANTSKEHYNMYINRESPLRKWIILVLYEIYTHNKPPKQ